MSHLPDGLAVILGSDGVLMDRRWGTHQPQSFFAEASAEVPSDFPAGRAEASAPRPTCRSRWWPFIGRRTVFIQRAPDGVLGSPLHGPRGGPCDGVGPQANGSMGMGFGAWVQPHWRPKTLSW